MEGGGTGWGKKKIKNRIKGRRDRREQNMFRSWVINVLKYA